MNAARNADNSRLEPLKGVKTIIVKVGSAVLTDEQGLNLPVMNSLAGQLAALSLYSPPLSPKIVLVSSGSIAAGKAVMAKAGKTDFPSYGKSRHALAAIGQSILMRAWNEAFAPWNMVTGQVLLTRDDLRSRGRFQTAAATFSEMLSWKVLPIVNENDTVSVSGLKFGDNDSLASLLINLVEADLFINLTSAPGVLAANPANNPDCEVIDIIDSIGTLDIDALCGEKTRLGSGGMAAKLLAARRVSQLGVPTLILPGREPDVLVRALGIRNGNPEKLGTWVNASQKSVSRRKFWLAYQSEPAGAVEIDSGAATALLHQGRSLLPGGIMRVSGEFDKGALVRVTHQGENLGVGFCNYSSIDLQKIKGLKRHEVAAILGIAQYPDVIHRDNLLLDAAI